MRSNGETFYVTFIFPKATHVLDFVNLTSWFDKLIKLQQSVQSTLNYKNIRLLIYILMIKKKVITLIRNQ